MRRIIEELIQKRKQQQKNLTETLDELGTLFENRGFLKLFPKRKNKRISQLFLQFNGQLQALITAQDKEWDAYTNNHATTVFKSLQWKIDKLEAEYTNVRTLLVNFSGLEQSLQRLIDSIDEKTGPVTTAKDETISQLERIRDQLSPYQYADFEQRFRGDEGAVKEKLKKYLPVFANADHILDIGCGRGEFMELLQEQGKRTQGIDISQSMLQIAADKGLDCSKRDALHFLKTQDRGTLGGIFSAQVIEHLEPGYLREMVLEAFRALDKNAPILLETVNPLSLFSLANIYFLDVTHVKPLHPEFMRYLLESCGFSGVKIIYQEESMPEQLDTAPADAPTAREFNTNVDKLNKLLYASPVYAVTGIKP